MSITIDKEFEALIPPLTSEEFQQLEENCVKEGIRDALITWNGVLIDGHNRFKIAAKHGMLWNEKRMEFADRDEAKLWIIRNQLGRRNLNSFSRSELAIQGKKLIAKKAEERKRGGQGGVLLNQKSDEAKEINTNKELAKIAGVSHDTIHKVETILNSGNEQLIEDARSGRESVNRAYQQAHPKKTPAQAKKEFLDDVKQEHEDFQNSKTVSIHQIHLDKANRKILASDLYVRLLNMGKRIDEMYTDMEEGEVDLKGIGREFTPEQLKTLRTTFRMWSEELMKIDREVKNG